VHALYLLKVPYSLTVDVFAAMRTRRRLMLRLSQNKSSKKVKRMYVEVVNGFGGVITDPGPCQRMSRQPQNRIKAF
jgi:hypothetical protein